MSDDKTISITRPLCATAWREGYKAGRLGRASEANPYSADTQKGRYWLLGMWEGRKKQLKLVGSCVE